MIRVTMTRHLKENNAFLNSEGKIYNTSIYAYLLSEKGIADKNPETLEYNVLKQTESYALVERDSKDYIDIYVISNIKDAKIK